MVHAYHVVWGTYGFWLPNDPRGSRSEFIASWELLKFGKATHSADRQSLDVAAWSQWRREAEHALKYPAIHLSGQQAAAVGVGFGVGVRKSGLTIFACSVLPEHVHLVIARHTYKVEQICNLLKGEATKALKAKGIHPQAKFAADSGELPTMWGHGQWKVYLESDQSIEAAIHYVEENPIKEGKPAQRWSFVTPFGGIPKGGWVTYH